MHEGRECEAFVFAHTALEAVPFVPEIRIHTATPNGGVTPIWGATQEYLARHDLGIPFWCVPWAGGQALARYVLDHPEVVREKRVVDFGAGSGLVAIAAMRAGAASVRAIDIDPFAVAACRLNARANGVELHAECIDIVGAPVLTDVLLAGDVWYERAAAERFYAWFSALNAAGVRVLTGDPGRFYVPSEAVELERYDVPTTLDLEAKTSLLTRVLVI